MSVVIKGGSRQNAAFFSKHLLNPADNEKVRVVGFRGFAQEDVKGAFREMQADAKETRCKNFFYHACINPEPGEELTEKQWDGAVNTLEHNLGLDGQPRFVVEHEKDGRVHRHVVWSRIDADTMTAIPDSLTYKKHEAAARKIERDCELRPMESVLVKDRKGERPKRRAKDWEGFRGKQTGLDPDKVKAQVTALWEKTDSAAAFKAALRQEGYILCKGDRRDFCIVDPAGDEHSLARRIEGVKAAELRERLGDIHRDALPSVAEARAMADAWGDTSEAARTVQETQMEKRKRAFLYGLRSMNPEAQEAWQEPPSSALEKAAHEYGRGVKGAARGFQDAYWQATIGGKPRTEADKLHDVMWGESDDKDRGPER